jgi:BirA family biotin operon repressor/biotin-[acetyl-CoA-carboxylase] ligase
MFEKREILDSVESTNDYLKAFLSARIDRMVVAGEQTSGKGQHGRSWYSPPGRGLYVSYLFYPSWSVQRSPVVNQASALAVVESIRRFERRADVRLKRPNDVYIGDRKVCGILSELGSTGNRVNWAIIGIGINLYGVDFPPELESTATSLERERIRVAHPLDFCRELTDRLVQNLERAASPDWTELEALYQQEVR